MTAETLTTSRSASTFPVSAGSTHGQVMAAFGTYEIAAVVEDGDIFEMCRIPKDAVVIMGWVMADDIDTGTEVLDMDVGWAGNGTEAADPDGFGDLGVWTGDAVTDIKPEATIFYPFGGVLRVTGPQHFSAETIIQVEANVASNAGHVGTLTVVVLYIVDPNFNAASLT